MAPNVVTARHRLAGTALRRYRKSLGWTMNDVARLSDVDASAVCWIEVGQRIIRQEHLRHLLAEYEAGAGVREVLGVLAILQFGPVPELAMVHVAGQSGGTCPSDPEVAATYLQAFTCLRVGALSPEESARHLRDLAGARLAA